MYSEQNENVSHCNLNELIGELNDGSEGAHLSSLGIELQTEKAKESERSPSDALLCASQLRRGIIMPLM